MAPLPLSLTVRTERWPIAGAFSISRGAKTEAQVVVVELNDGYHRGRGECVPYARYDETVAGVMAALSAIANKLTARMDWRAGSRGMVDLYQASTLLPEQRKPGWSCERGGLRLLGQAQRQVGVSRSAFRSPRQRPPAERQDFSPQYPDKTKSLRQLSCRRRAQQPLADIPD